MIIEKDVLLSPYTSWLVGGKADHFCLPKNLEELKDVLAWSVEKSLPVTILGGGSNVLVSDKGIRGMVICLKKFTGSEVKEESGHLKITSWAGTGKSELLKIFLKYKLSPALFLAGLPGDVGGGVVMNAGVGEMMTPREFVEIVEWVEVLRWTGGNFETQRYKKADLKWDYRHSEGWKPGIVIRVGFSWPLTPDPDILEKVKSANRVRLSKQPLDKPSCGSVFVNPPGAKSAQLIDNCGLKGFTIGGAQVSLKHANFIVNIGDAKAADMRAVIEHIKKTVLEKTQVELKTEVVMLGDFD